MAELAYVCNEPQATHDRERRAPAHGSPEKGVGPVQVVEANMPQVEESAAKGRATRREWLGLAVIALPCVVYAMDLTVLNLAVPTLSAQLRPSGSELLWIIDIYGFMVAGFLVTMGTLGDRIGRRKLLLTGAACFGVCSVLAAFAQTSTTLIATRALLGVAGATLAPSTLSLIRNMFHDERERATAIGVWVASYSVGGAIGPLVGGVLLESFWWGSVFLLAVPVMALLLIAGPYLLPEYRDPVPGFIDVPSVFLSLGAVLTFIFGLKRAAEHGLGLVPSASIALGLLLAALFIRRQRHLASPFVDLKLFRVRAFSASLVAYGLGCFAMFGVFIVIGQYLQLVLGFSPLVAGLWSAPSSVVFIAASLLAPRVARHVSLRWLMAGGLGTAACGFMLIAQVDAQSGLSALVTGTVLMSIGMSAFFTLGNDIIVGSAPAERAGSAAAISETCAELSGAVGIAIFGSIGTAIYRRAMDSALPRELMAQARGAVGTLGGSIDVARGLPDPDRTLFLTAANEAFVDALRASAWLASAVSLLAAVLLARVLRPNS